MWLFHVFKQEESAKKVELDHASQDLQLYKKCKTVTVKTTCKTDRDDSRKQSINPSTKKWHEWIKIRFTRLGQHYSVATFFEDSHSWRSWFLYSKLERSLLQRRCVYMVRYPTHVFIKISIFMIPTQFAKCAAADTPEATFTIGVFRAGLTISLRENGGSFFLPLIF